MPKLSLRQVLAFAGLHVVVLVMVFLVVLTTVPMFDEDWSPSILGRAAKVLLGVLAMPMLAAVNVIPSESGHPTSVEWTLLILNSLVWGVGIAFMRAWWKQRRRE